MPKNIFDDIIRGSIWSTPSVSAQPVVILQRWRVLEVENQQGQVQRHFVGYNAQDWEGRVSTAIQQFDPVSGQGITRSGRTYQLMGKPGYDSDGAWVWVHWSKAQGLTNERDVSREFWSAMVNANQDLEEETK